MTAKYDRAQICRQAWQIARTLARSGNNKVARAFLGQGFKNAWYCAKRDAQIREIAAAVKATMLRREDCATKAQIAYIDRLGGKADCNTSKRDASAMIDKLLAARNSRQSYRNDGFEHYEPSEWARISHLRRVHGAIVD